MASKWKTYASNEILTATDVNDSLNPSTADHIPRAVAAGRATVPGTSGATTVVAFPAGRFSATPVVTATLNSASGSHNYNAVRVYNTTSAGFSLLTNVGSVPADVNWIAVQM